MNHKSTKDSFAHSAGSETKKTVIISGLPEGQKNVYQVRGDDGGVMGPNPYGPPGDWTWHPAR